MIVGFTLAELVEASFDKLSQRESWISSYGRTGARPRALTVSRISMREMPTP